jgi:hypothetical protein
MVLVPGVVARLLDFGGRDAAPSADVVLLFVFYWTETGLVVLGQVRARVEHPPLNRLADVIELHDWDRMRCASGSARTILPAKALE